MPRLLIFCDAFQPPAYLPRLRYLCSYLTERGWQLTVVTETVKHEPNCPPVSARFIAIPYYRTTSRFNKIDWVIKIALNMLFDYKGRLFYRRATRLLKGESFDAVFCTTFSTFPLPTAERFAEKHALPLMVDLRDIVEQAPVSIPFQHRPPRFLGKQIVSSYYRLHIRRRNRTLRKAACITTVSPWHVELIRQINPNTHLIYNGYDPAVFYPGKVISPVFEIVYTGRIYSEDFRDPTLLFEALSLLLHRGEVTPEQIVLSWYVDEQSQKRLARLAADRHVKAMMQYHAFVHPKEIPDILRRSSIILVLTSESNACKTHGILTTKFFEAIGVNKPVLCIPNDGSHLARLIREVNVGIAAENAEQVADFILHQLQCRQQQGYTSAALNQSAAAQFSRLTQGNIFEDFLKQMIDHTSQSL
ncbi:MAG: glycosyltransferase [Prevotellaceae bacterium]|jgi:glycosyltransferase involved in cell wall biosynthesis|nr:glycosyltransferase [Prevotellaceae bacterium]